MRPTSRSSLKPLRTAPPGPRLCLHSRQRRAPAPPTTPRCPPPRRPQPRTRRQSQSVTSSGPATTFDSTGRRLRRGRGSGMLTSSVWIPSSKLAIHRHPDGSELGARQGQLRAGVRPPSGPEQSLTLPTPLSVCASAQRAPLQIACLRLMICIEREGRRKLPAQWIYTLRPAELQSSVHCHSVSSPCLAMTSD